MAQRDALRAEVALRANGVLVHPLTPAPPTPVRQRFPIPAAAFANGTRALELEWTMPPSVGGSFCPF